MNSPSQPIATGSDARRGRSPRRTLPPGSIATGSLLVLAVMAISSSAVLVRFTDAPSLTLSWWRTLGGGLILAPAASRWWRQPPPETRTSARRGLALPLFIAGTALGAHFWTWLASLERTSVAASVALVSTAPFFVAGIAWFSGRRADRPGSGLATWPALLITVAGAVLIGLAGQTDGPAAHRIGTAAAGNVLAVIGAALMAVYLVAGDRLRTHEGLSTAAYAGPVYLVASGALSIGALATGVNPFALEARDLLVIAAMIAGPQLCGHTVLNLLLGRLGAITIALVLLAEPVGASLLAWLIVDERPGGLTLLGAALVVAGLTVRLILADQALSERTGYRTSRRAARAS